MKKALIGLGVFVVVVIVAALAAPAIVPVSAYKGRLLTAIQETTGRTARIDGEFSFSIFPSVQFVAGKVSLANAPGARPANMVTLDKMRVKVALWPLLSGHVKIDSFVLDQPLIALSVNKNGVPNWQFGKAAAGRTSHTPTDTQQAPTTETSSMISGLTLGDVRIVDGAVSYTDARTDKSYMLSNVNVTLSLPSLTSPMQIDGSLFWHKEKVALSLHANDPNALLNAKSSALSVTVSSPRIKLNFEGDATNGTPFKAHGTVDLNVPSVRELAAWTGSPLAAPGSGFGPLAVKGTADIAGKKVSFIDATLALDAIKGTGSVHYDGGRRRPYVQARLKLGTLDLNPYLPPAGAAPAPAAAPTTGTAPAAWSNAPFDLTSLKQADADLDLTLGGLVVRKIKVGDSHLAVSLKGGRLAIDLDRMALYDGKGMAKLTVDGAAAVPVVGLVFNLSGLKAQPFLTDSIGLGRLEGTANGHIDVKGAGRSERSLISALNGSGTLQFLNGAIRGINLAAMVRNAKGAFLNTEAKKTQKTDFAELSGTFTVRNGVLSNNDLEMKSPLLRIAGKGTVNLPQRSLNYRVEPKVVASTVGQGGKSDLSGLMVPVIVSGPWNNLSYRPDLSSIVKQKGLEQLQKLLPGNGGSSTSGATGSSTPTAPSTPKDLMKQLLGK